MKAAAIERNFRKIKNQFPQTLKIVKHSKPNSLWEHEASVRKKIKTLLKFKDQSLNEYEDVYSDYVSLLNYISKKLLDEYNFENGTHFKFEKIIENAYDSYIQFGIINVLITNHIPEIVAKQFDLLFPSNPKNEYPFARNSKRKFVLHLGETNTGKTYDAMQCLKASRKGIYLSPLRILALENYERLNSEGIKCNLLTGEEEIIVAGASHTCCTIEKLNLSDYYDVAIIDEAQLIDDDERGDAWTRALLGIKCREIHVCGALNVKNILIDIIEDCGDTYELKEYKRKIPLKIDYTTFSYNDTSEGDALVAFSKKKVLNLAYYYSKLGIKASILYGDLPPEVRKKQYEKFLKKESKILITTDAIGMGVNLPIKRIVFMDIKKFDGNEVRFLTSQEVKQIAGRAGRMGIYNVGYVATFNRVQNFISDNLNTKDVEIEEAVHGPSSEILKIKELSLREKLALWASKPEKLYFYRKMDVSDYLIVLDSIKNYRLPEKTQWKLLRIPFDVSSSEMMTAFLNYVDELFINDADSLSRPRCLEQNLSAYELYYQKLNLYYSFSKAFSLDFDDDFVKEQRFDVSEKINSILIKI